MAELTTRGRVLLLVPIFLFVVGVLLQSPFTIISGAGLFSIFIYSQYVIGDTPDISVKDEVASGLKYVDEPFYVKHILEPESPVRLDIEPALGDEFSLEEGPEFEGLITKKKIISYPLVPKSRGHHELGGLKGWIYDPFRIFRTEFEHDIVPSVAVSSSKEAIKKAQTYAKSKHAEEFIVTPSKFYMRSNEFDGIREYQPGDPMRDIHWKSFSKFQRRMTKTYQNISPIDCHVMIDCSPSMRRKLPDGTTKLEQSIYVGLEILKNFELLGHGIGFTAYDHKNILYHQDPESKKRSFEKIYALMTELPGSIETDEEPVQRYEHIWTGKVEGLDEEEKRFSEKVSQFISQFSQKEIAGILYAVDRLKLLDEKEKLVIILSDLETNPNAIIRGVEKLRKRKNEAWTIVPFSNWYEATDVDEETLERAYKDYEKLEEIIHQLKKLDTSIFELHPQKEGLRIMEEWEARKT